jgi:LysR family transcriptional regulator, glycine cleavage system transcriptional activator
MLRSKSARRLPPLHALRAFEAAARHLSFKEAANELGVTPTAISHHVRQLEDLLDLKLFQRRIRRIELTSAGQELYPILRDGFDAFANSIAQLKSRKLRSVVTLSATVAFTARWLVPRVPEFHRAYPRMDLRLHASDDPVDLQAGTVDAAIRYGRGDYAGLSAQKLFDDVFAPVCSPSLRLRHPQDLVRHPLIHFEWRRTRRDNPVWNRWLKNAGLPDLRAKSDLIFTDESQAIQAAVAGHGVALISLVLARDDLARGTLVQPFAQTLAGYAYYLVYPPERAESERISVVRTWIREEISGVRSVTARG